MMLDEKHDVERTGLFHTDQNALKNLLMMRSPNQKDQSTTTFHKERSTQ